MRFSEWFKGQEGLTQQAFASTVGVTQGRIAQLLDGDLPSLPLAFRIAAATDGKVTPNDFLQLAAGRNPAPHTSGDEAGALTPASPIPEPAKSLPAGGSEPAACAFSTRLGEIEPGREAGLHAGSHPIPEPDPSLDIRNMPFHRGAS